MKHISQLIDKNLKNKLKAFEPGDKVRVLAYDGEPETTGVIMSRIEESSWWVVRVGDDDQWMDESLIEVI